MKKTLKGKFWSNDVKKNSIKKLIEKPYFKKNKFYPEIKKELKDVMVWDWKNKKIKNFLKGLDL